jgi:hypothetical protein
MSRIGRQRQATLFTVFRRERPERFQRLTLLAAMIAPTQATP